MKLIRFFFIWIIMIFFPLFCLKSEENQLLTPQEKLELYGYRLHPHSYHHPQRYKTSLIQLQDSSIWFILPEDETVIKSWRKSHDIFIKPAYSCFWPECLYTYNYVLYNLNENKVIAVYLEEIENHALLIEAIDTDTHTLFLNDKTIWKMDEQAPISEWQVGQGILIGVNNYWYKVQYSQILINADLNGHPYIPAFFLNNQE